jgi:hypothetical protein
MLGFDSKNIDKQPFRKTDPPPENFSTIAPAGHRLSMSQQGVGSCLASARDLHAPGV